MTTDKIKETEPVSITAPHAMLGNYVSHHPSNRIRLVLRAALFYAIPVLILQALFWNVDTGTASRFLPALFAAAGLGAFWYAAHLWNREVILYENGFTYQQGSQIGHFRYGDIVRVQPDVQRIALLNRFQLTTYRYTLITDEDEILKISNLYSDIDKLINRLESAIVRHRLARIEGEVADGKAVGVGGGLRLSQTGLEYDGRELFWHEFGGQRVQNGNLILKTQDEAVWATLPVAELDNPVLVLNILKQYAAR